MKAPLAENDYRQNFSRFQGENLIDNLKKVEVLKQISHTKGSTLAQLAIA
ncbi:hypothetical protein QNI19_08935 [Cytophagaceae bacterium DM2B3-1]|uniref:Uncharacterized protein n=1 Tax=Xanthocytophaga flava TaxID=3048013 RepID=A0ABT7CJ82_9BACT|nr:hypothetical protein [Xanthocytophaga flavus]MDJ1472357.1 hypothetical protein [Xanthocytophaga flavus]MDJ1493055.1 hypothetical protein [Xanthocytophaga flavus]